MSTAARPLPARASRLFLLRTQLRYEAQVKYLGSIAGVYWAIVNPIVQVGAYVFFVTVIFNARLQATESGRFDYAIFILAGMGAWLAVQEGLVSSAGSLVRHSDIVKNVVFPLELLPIAAILVSLLSLAVSSVALVALVLASGRGLGASLVAVPIVLVPQLLVTVGVGFALAIVTVFLRDLLYLLPLVFQILTLLTPIAYSLEDMPEPLQDVTRVNPLYYVIDGYRRIFFYGEWPSWLGLLYSTVVGLVLLAGGLFVFRRLKGYAEGLV